MKRYAIILLHLGYWLVYLLLIALIVLMTFQKALPLTPRSYFGFLFFSPAAILFFVPGLLGFYTFYTLLFPAFLLKKKVFLLVIAGVITAILISLLSGLILSLRFGAGFMFADGPYSFIAECIIMAFLALIHGIIALVMHGFISWYGDIKLKEELNKRNHDMELSLIKAQINPHFLFNTINNIDVLIQKDAVRASDYLNKLSDMMRFMLYEIKTEKISLEKELAYLYKYVELQKIRTSNPNYVNLEISGEAVNRKIAPMLFIPFIENAFKHSSNKKINQAINIRITIEKDRIAFECENHYSPDIKPEPEYGGLGNELIQRRLAMLYAGKHIFGISDRNEIYKVNLLLLSGDEN